MKNIVAIIVVVIVLAGGGALLISKHHKSNTTTAATSSSMANMSMPSSSSSTSSSSKPSATNAVTIQNFAFSPADITVKKGATVTWTNQDTTEHTVSETDGKTGPSSSSLAKGKSYSFTYNTVGTFKYNCSIHPNMVGSVTVTN